MLGFCAWVRLKKHLATIDKKSVIALLQPCIERWRNSHERRRAEFD